MEYRGVDPYSPEVLPELRYTIESATEAKERESMLNFDAFFADIQTASAGVFDGVGDNRDSNRAAQIAADTVQAHLSDVPFLEKPRVATDIMRAALEATHINIIEALQPRHPSEFAPTTAVIAKIFVTHTGQRYVAGAYSGDSRAYAVSQGFLSCLTLDHIQGFRYENHDKRWARQLRFAKAKHLEDLPGRHDELEFKLRNVIGTALGSYEPPHIDVFVRTINDGDSVILTSDGVHDNLTDPEIESTFNSSQPGKHAEAIMHAAKAVSILPKDEYMRAKKDDITTVVLNFS